MKNSINISALILVLAILAMPGIAGAVTLLEIYQQALQSDPLIHEAEARRLASLEAKPQARGAYLPQVTATSNYSVTNRSGPVSFFTESGRVTLDAEIETDTFDWNFGLRQTLFRWDQIVGLKRANKTVARAMADYESAQQDLIVRVTQRYFDVLAAEDRLTAIHANRNAISRQLEQAKQRFDVGLIAITDVQESQAAYDQAIADEIAAKRSLATAREYLREITGQYVAELAAPTERLPLNSPDPNDEEAWVELAFDQNLALVSSRIDEQLARDEISFRKSGHYPTLDLVANKRETETETTVSATGFNSVDTVTNPSDTIGLQFSIPLFSGGATSSRVREAVYLHRASREQLQRVTRETERQARDAYLGVLSEISRVKALERAVESNKTALEATEAGFEVGTRTIVDVLNAQFLHYQSITNYYQSRYDYVLNVMRLKQAAGNLQVQDLERLEPFLEARKSPEQQFAEEEKAKATP
jgi:outer membrane protein